ncbi:DNA repair protein XRCC3-like [Varroa destructor]|uniref:RecA family profile 1 domain-containing protein n=1 Tax=Varroa destructor TaxID=109461 RepID=A0A7M7J4Y1_VARDE|nr:DNA repair protein XRCC3-like [Varroa destructor]XP_022646924.1 DNA repair protein XRCC3-like [Varroa destructor]XP_022646925.1 DNA repair protein XRCC3-like [Varroa destructor]XP_022646926.1 DNA repair protein XRCC3-like [Varroa destructor]XP_022646927.1 DNA repair protein XRCC3-like [Varroa destructor]XP_022646928.1 DNA repair protein XRCC3-like [Varroa destructor]
MSSSTKLIRGENDLVLTEAELALRGTEKKLAYTLSPSEIQDGAALTLEKVARIELLQRSKQIVDNMNARGLPEPRNIFTAFQIADLLGGNGFQTGRGVIEITGEASSGKTQLLLDIALSCPHRAAYVVTEGRFPGNRLCQLASNKQRWPNASMDKILISRVADLDQLMKTLDKDLPRLLTTGTIDAILIDSITWPFRVEEGCKERTKSIQDVVRKLHRFSKKYNVLIVCANQVAADLASGVLRPCLGTSWSKGVSGRLMLSIKDRELGLRNLRVDWCESYFQWCVGKDREFQIRPEGLVALNGDDPT